MIIGFCYGFLFDFCISFCFCTMLSFDLLAFIPVLFLVDSDEFGLLFYESSLDGFECLVYFMFC